MASACSDQCSPASGEEFGECTLSCWGPDLDQLTEACLLCLDMDVFTSPEELADYCL